MFGRKTLRKFFFSWQKSDGDGAKEKTPENLEEVRKEIEINPTDTFPTSNGNVSVSESVKGFVTSEEIVQFEINFHPWLCQY